MPPITEVGNSVIVKSHIGCFFGSIVASLFHVLMVGGVIKRKKNIPAWIYKLNIYKANSYLWKVTLIVSVASIFHLLYRIGLLGNIDIPVVATTLVGDLRYSFLFTDIGYTRYFNFVMSFTFCCVYIACSIDR